MPRWFYLTSVAVIAAMISASQLQSAPMVCAAHDKITTRLAQHFGELRQSGRLTDGGMWMEVFTSPDTGSWTIVRTAPDGWSCLIAAGQAFAHPSRATLGIVEGI